MKKAIVVGGTSGIGQAITKELIDNDYQVAITGIEQDVIERHQDSEVEAIYLDGTKEDAHIKLLELVDKLGGIDLLVFSAGIGNLNKDLGHKVENLANRLNVLTFTEITDWAYRYFEKQGHGHLVSVSSISGLFGSRVAPAYHAAKAYQISYLNGLRQKSKKSNVPISITDIRPGFVETPMTEGKKMFWVCKQEKAGKQIFNLIRKKRNYGYISRRWHLAAFLINIIPTWIWVRM